MISITYLLKLKEMVSLLSEDVEDYLDSYNLTCFLKLGTASDLDNSLFCTVPAAR